MIGSGTGDSTHFWMVFMQTRATPGAFQLVVYVYLLVELLLFLCDYEFY